MNREQFKLYILETYHTDNDFPWEIYPNYEVFRHPANKKWFAVVMDVPREKLGLVGKEKMDVVNLKCDPRLIGSFRMKEGFFPAYHMRKDSWITAALNDSVSDEDIKALLEMSFDATAPRRRKK